MYAFIQKTDGIIAPLKAAYDYAVNYFPVLDKKPYAVIPTGHYIDIYPNEIDQVEARGKLHLPGEAKIIGFVGNISAYKGIHELLKVFNELHNQDIILLLAGIPANEETKHIVEEAAAKDKRIKIYWGLIPNNELQWYLNASDFIALPFRKINNSGSLYLALSFNKHVLVPDFPQMLEVKKEYAPEHVHTYPKGELSAADLVNLLDRVRDHQPDTRPDLAKMDYDVLAGETINFFKSLLT